MTVVDVRDAAVGWAKWGPEHEADIHYSMKPIRQSWLTKPAGALPMTTDCSGFAIACMKWAGADVSKLIPNGALGFTGTLLAVGRLLKSGEARLPGDVRIYGGGTGDHAVILLDDVNSANPLVVSHGQEAGPIIVRDAYEHPGALRRDLRFDLTKVVANPKPAPRPKPTALTVGAPSKADRYAAAEGMVRIDRAEAKLAIHHGISYYAWDGQRMTGSRKATIPRATLFAYAWCLDKVGIPHAGA